MALAVGACEWIGGFQDFERDGAATPHVCDDLPAFKDSEGRKGTRVVLVKVQGGGCFWIDKTETTVAQYQAWVDGLAPGFSDWSSAHCGWKTSVSDPTHDAQDSCAATVVSAEDDPWHPKKPIRCVDWCDAEAYCRRNGARLCSSYATGFEPVGIDDSQWVFACTSGKTSKLPWGNDAGCWNCCNLAAETICPNGPGSKCQPGEVGSWPSCTSSAGAMDLLGNVREWVFSCEAGAKPDNGNAECRALGRSFDDFFGNLTCPGVGATLPRNTRDRWTGFRCCEELDESTELPNPTP